MTALFEHLKKVKVRRFPSSFRGFADRVNDVMDDTGNFALRNDKVPASQCPPPMRGIRTQDMQNAFSDTFLGWHRIPLFFC